MYSKPELLVTGASGFVGRQVIARARDRFTVLATGRGDRPSWLPEGVTWYSIDLLDPTSVAKLPAYSPYVLHLASESVPSLFSTYTPLLDAVKMTLNLCQHLRSGRLLFASSCLVYAASMHPLAEDAALNPRGNYGLAKLICETIVARAPYAEPCIARPFNHIGIGMRPDLVIPSIIRRVRNAANGSTIKMVGLNSIRDFLDVSDIVEAYFTILLMGKKSDPIFNVASGTPTSISDIVRAVSKLFNKNIGEIIFDDRDNSSDDTSIITGNAQKLFEATGWSPRVSLEKSLENLCPFGEGRSGRG